MNTPHDGGPAFPILEQSFTGGFGVAQSSGMSLRDWFASHIISAIIQNSSFFASLSKEAIESKTDPTIEACRVAYSFAEGMLMVREMKS